MKTKILLIDDDETLLTVTKKVLEREEYETLIANNYNQALEMLDQVDFELIVTDVLLGNHTGIDILREVKRRDLICPVILITGYPNIDSAAEAVRLGAYDYIPKPVKIEDLLHATKMALHHKAALEERDQYRLNFEAIFKSVKDIIITVDKDLNVMEINKAAEEMFKVAAGDVKTKPYKKICKEKRVEEALGETIKTKKPVEIRRFECNSSSLSKHVVSLTTYPILDRHRKFNGCVLVLKDDTRLVELERNLHERQQFHNLIGKSSKMQNIYSLIEDLSDVKTTVLITGESGTGKELVADALHCRYGQSNKPLVKVNCAALSDELLESELFGHVKGAFTGAVNERIGRFQMANGGSIFLDEIGDISNKMQLRLLRILQEMEFERVGDSTTVKVDVRVIAATNQNLREKIQEGTFREDLYHRLAVMQLDLPALREKVEDIPMLVEHFLGKFNNKFKKKIDAISDDVQKIFVDYAWPGNVRELQNILERAFIVCRKSVITIDDLHSDFVSANMPQINHIKEKKNIDREVLAQTLEKTGWNKAKAARLLGISRKSIYEKLKKYNISND